MDEDIEAAGAALDALAEGPAQRASAVISTAFAQTGETIETALSRAARQGELSFSRLTDSILRDLARLAVERVVEQPLQNALEGVLSGLPFFGARAEGGPVNPGGAYLVGERGPEMFVPTGNGDIAPVGPRPLTINISVASGTDAPSEDRIARAVSRAVQRGSRYL